MLNNLKNSINRFLVTVTVLVLTCPAGAFAAEQAVVIGGDKPWWYWPVILFFFCFILGILAVMAGVGGGVLYVPLVSGFFPFHIDFVRGVGLMVALAGALAAGPGLLRRNLANLRLALPVALIASAFSIIGAMLGLYLSALNPDIIQVCLGATIVGIACLLIFSKNSEKPVVTNQDAISMALGLGGVYWDEGGRENVEWKTHRTLLGMFMFILIGLVAGMFGLGAGWANVPVLNLMMGAPLKVSVATSKFLLSITDTSAAWIYMNRGCVIPLIGVPSIVGLMLGSLLGVRLLAIAKPKMIRVFVIVVLLFAGLKAMDKGLGLGILG
ncbi:MAG: sulfite exporter TauE/SafE family protein [Proteobacteria bacterium]|nr:sulfite exporter TauE/SafE family protein [Desulfobacula sp.]MBU3954188.1 sulfite exporter TauE/SafE family protein [Pseudomonadota bacterium]MBU4129572.1 sulfite exporter TauE/SafE family protein [Pseudomonadota bacterium]